MLKSKLETFNNRTTSDMKHFNTRQPFLDIFSHVTASTLQLKTRTVQPKTNACSEASVVAYAWEDLHFHFLNCVTPHGTGSQTCDKVLFHTITTWEVYINISLNFKGTPFDIACIRNKNKPENWHIHKVNLGNLANTFRRESDPLCA